MMFLLLSLMLCCATVHAATVDALKVNSATGEPLQTTLLLKQLPTDTDSNCFDLKSNHQVSFDYTTLADQQGALTLWSDTPLTEPITVIVHDRCQHTQHRLVFKPDNSSQTTENTRPATPEAPAVAPAAIETHIITPPAVPVEAYTALQAQINELQQNFKQLQTKSDVLYANNVAQTSILTSLKLQLIQLQNENQLLRTLVIALGLALIGSGFFFADWLRRNAAIPKVIKSRAPSKSPTASTANPNTQPPFSAEQTPTQPLVAPKAGSRLKSVPLHANDDAVAPHLVPQKVSSQQNTQTVMQDASRLFTHGRVNQAIEHLQQHLAKHPKCSPWMWLYLLDLLSKEGKQQEFDIVASECRKHFNLNVERSPELKVQGIESFPRVMKALQQAWGTPQVIALIDDLVYNTRLVPRMGFERSVFEDLMLLKEIACQTQNLPAVPPAAKMTDDEAPLNGNLRELQQLSEDIYILAPVDHTPFQYWTDFTFELDEPGALRKSA